MGTWGHFGPLHVAQKFFSVGSWPCARSAEVAAEPLTESGDADGGYVKLFGVCVGPCSPCLEGWCGGRAGLCGAAARIPSNFFPVVAVCIKGTKWKPCLKGD